MSTTEISQSVPAQSTDVSAAKNTRGDEVDGRVCRACAEVLPRHGWYVPLKVVFEFLLSIVLLIAAVPFIVVAAILIKLTTPGPIFYLQTRLGKHGRKFRLIKLRTMIHNAEAKTGPTWTKKNDSRITPVGRFLRDTHIDEFTQLINVLLGQMSLIGPRPERPEIAEKIEWEVDNYNMRLNVRPGVTGLSQLKLPPDTDLEDVRRKLRHDLYYVRYHSPLLDLKIFCATAWLLAKTMFAAAWKLIALPSIEKVNDRVEKIIDHEPEVASGNRQAHAD